MWLYDLKFEILELTDAFAMLLRLHGEIKEWEGAAVVVLSFWFVFSPCLSMMQRLSGPLPEKFLSTTLG